MRNRHIPKALTRRRVFSISFDNKLVRLSTFASANNFGKMLEILQKLDQARCLNSRSLI